MEEQTFTNVPPEALKEQIDRNGIVFLFEPMKDYLAQKQFISSSMLHDMITLTPYQFIYKWTLPDEETEALIFGSAFHTYILEPEKFLDQYMVLLRRNLPEPDKNFVNTANKNYRNTLRMECEVDGKILLQEEDFSKLVMMKDRLATTGSTKNILSQQGLTEISIYTTVTWNERKYYIKLRPDRVSLIKPFYLDLKKTKDASPAMNKFPKDAFTYGYDIKVAFYFDVLKEHWEKLMRFTNTEPLVWKYDTVNEVDVPEWVPLKRALIIAVEDEPPFDFSVFNIPDDTMEIGRYRYKQSLARFAECLDSGNWPGYEMMAEEGSGGIINLVLPKYAGEEIVI